MGWSASWGVLTHAPPDVTLPLLRKHLRTLLRVRDDDIPTFVADGVADFGIVGRNVLEEHGKGASEVVMSLGFGKCDLKIATPIGFAYKGPGSLKGLRIATSYPNVLGKFLEDNGVRADIVTLSGAVEVAPRLKLAMRRLSTLLSTSGTTAAHATGVRCSVRSETNCWTRCRRRTGP